MTRRSWFALAALLGAAAVLWLATRSADEPPAVAPATVRREAPRPSPSADLSGEPATSAATDPERIAAAAAEAPRYPLDLEWLKSRLPDNLYWELDAPTSDPEVAKERAERAKRSNDAYGRVLSGEASEQEIRDYYAQRRKISQDYLELSRVVLAEKGDELPPRDRGMFELSERMHRDRLQQIERDLSDALARKAAPR